ncbi:MAG: hypothetical protein JSW28_07895 [Thermoplasmata archaeon]|nr:MAG: hypothetical protein JSW28_07895 [Thermoplasmata archaeon]
MTETKKITLKVLGAEMPEVEDVQIEKGTTPADIKLLNLTSTITEREVI